MPSGIRPLCFAHRQEACAQQRASGVVVDTATTAGMTAPGKRDTAASTSLPNVQAPR